MLSRRLKLPAGVLAIANKDAGSATVDNDD
jgi:hypothetical protein